MFSLVLALNQCSNISNQNELKDQSVDMAIQDMFFSVKQTKK